MADDWREPEPDNHVPGAQHECLPVPPDGDCGICGHHPSNARPLPVGVPLSLGCVRDGVCRASPCICATGAQHEGDAEPSAREYAMRFLEKLEARGAMQTGGVIPCYVPIDDLARALEAYAARKVAEAVAAERERLIKALSYFRPEGVEFWDEAICRLGVL